MNSEFYNVTLNLVVKRKPKPVVPKVKKAKSEQLVTLTDEET